MVDVILGLLEPQEGKLSVDGQLITVANSRQWQRSVGYVPQYIYLVDDSVAANIAFGVKADNIDLQAVERAAKIAHLHEFVVNDLPQGYATRRRARCASLRRAASAHRDCACALPQPASADSG